MLLHLFYRIWENEKLKNLLNYVIFHNIIYVLKHYYPIIWLVVIYKKIEFFITFGRGLHLLEYQPIKISLGLRFYIHFIQNMKIWLIYIGKFFFFN